MGILIFNVKFCVVCYNVFVLKENIFSGNDAIVAFSRRYEVVVVIHQLNEALWKIGEESEQKTDTQQQTTNASPGKVKVIFTSGII